MRRRKIPTSNTKRPSDKESQLLRRSESALTLRGSFLHPCRLPCNSLRAFPAPWWGSSVVPHGLLAEEWGPLTRHATFGRDQRFRAVDDTIFK